MEAQQAGENSAKPRDVERGGAGDVDNNTLALTPTYSDSTLANANAQTDELYARHAAGLGSSVLDPAQSAHLCLLAAKSPKSNIYKRYDKTRRSRNFIPHWVVEYPWLEFSPEKECMFCIYCREYQGTHDPEFTNTFVHGATNFRLDSVKAHDNSTKHRQVMLVMSGKIASVPKPASKQVQVAKSPRAGGGQGADQMDRLRVGAFFDSDVEGYDDPQMMGATSSTIHRALLDDEGNPRHISPSSDLTEEPFYPPNPMAKYIKTLQNIYPHIPLNEMASSEPRLATNHPSSHSSPSSRVEDAPSQVMVKMEREEELVSLHLEEQPQIRSYDGTEPDVGEVPSRSMGPGMIARSVPTIRKVWRVNESSSMSQEEEEENDDQEMGGEYDQTGDDGVPNELGDHPDQEYEAEPAEGLLQRSGAMTDYFISPTVPVFRQGKRTSRLLPKAKRQKLEKIMARQMVGEDMMNAGDSLGDQRFQSEPEDNGVNSSSSHDPDWRRLAESFAMRYNQLCEEHTTLMKLFQTKVTSLEKKCNDLEKACKTRQKVPPTSPNRRDGIPGRQETAGAGSQVSPRINMYSSVVVLQVQGQDPVNISSNSDANFHTVQQNLSQSGIHISLRGNNIPNNIEQQLSLHAGAGDQRSHSKVSSPSASSRTTEEASGSALTRAGESLSKNNVCPERAEISTREGIMVSDVVSGVGSTFQKDVELQKSDLSGHGNQTETEIRTSEGNTVSERMSGVGSTLQKDSETRKSDLSGHDENQTDGKKHGYLLGNGMVADDSVLSGDGPSLYISRTDVSAPPNIGDDVEGADISCCNNPGSTSVEAGMDLAGDHRSAPSEHEKVTASSSASSTSNGMI